MVKGRARFMGATSANDTATEAIPYNPAILQGAAAVL